EALSSVDITTSNYDAELGRAGGAVTNVTLRSGTNERHGSVYEFNCVKAMAGREPFSSARPHTRLNPDRFTFRGPIIKNKTFFFGDYQALRDRRGDSTRPTIPTMAFRTGDLSAGLNLPTPQIVYDPRTGNPDGTGRQPFKGNVIPDDRISPIARRLLSYIAPPTSSGFANNYEADTVRVKDTDSFDVKVDHHINTSNTFFVRYNF